MNDLVETVWKADAAMKENLRRNTGSLMDVNGTGSLCKCRAPTMVRLSTADSLSEGR